MSIILCLAFTFGFLFESIFGFGGGIVSYSILIIFFDMKDIILMNLYIGTLSSAIILGTGFKNASFLIILKKLPYIVAGLIVGLLLFKIAPSKPLIRSYSIVLILISLRALLFREIEFGDKVSKVFLVFGGLVQGLFGVGGPFLLLGLKKDLKDKTSIKSSLAFLFVIMNLFRYSQISLTGVAKYNYFMPYWYAILPVCLSLYAGHRIHKIIKPAMFDRLLYICILVSAVLFLIVK